ncbi:MAG: hypothetical protein J0L92_28850 [Deltaproteobacteria bacterium]|nr:hypothetical protein [Deltaproteobacteria bacterium]
MADKARDRASKLAIVFFSALAIVVASGCDLFGGANPDGGPDSEPADAMQRPALWTLGPVNRGAHHPGTWLTFAVDGIDAPADDVYLWVIEDRSAFPLRAARSRVVPIEPGLVSDDDAGALDDAGRPIPPDGGVYRSSTFALPLPIVRAGVFHLAVGTAEGPMTREAEVEVVLGGATMTQTEAADALALGLDGLVTDIGDLLHTVDPDWQTVAAEPQLADTIGAFAAITEGLDEAGATAREQYLALGPDVEPGVQELLWNSGVLSTLAARASGVSMWTFGSGMLDSAIARSPFQGVLFTLDAISMLLAVFGIACDVIAIVGTIITLPAGGEGGLVGLAPKMVAAVLRVIIDNVVPSDLLRIFEVHRSHVVYGTEGSMVVPWGVFAPQNRTAGANARSLEDIVLAMMPISPTVGLRELLEELAEYLVTHLPGVGIDAWLNRIPSIPRVEIAIPVDMGFYNIQLSQVLRLNPAFVGLAAGAEVLYDPELVQPYTASFARSGGRVTVAYDTRSVGFTDLSWPSAAPSARTAALLEIQAFAFASTGPEALDVQLVQIPLPYASNARAFFQVQQAPDPADRSARISDEDFIVLDVNLVGGGTTRVVRPSTTSLRVHPLTIDDLAGGRFDQTQVNVYVNGALQHPGQIVPDATVLTLPLTLEPGVNEIRVVVTDGHDIGCGPSGTDAVCLEMTFAEADNVNVRYVLYGAEGSERTYRVWTPPLFPPPE